MKKIIFTFALAVVSNLVYAEPEPAASAVPVVEAAKANNNGERSGVRKPVGDVNQFWNEIPWEELSPEEQQLWAVLSDGASWDKLSKEKKEAAKALGFDRKSWNSVPAGSSR